MSARKSKVWGYFSRVNDKKALCNICKADVASSGGTTNMSTHLRRHHKIDLSMPQTTIQQPHSNKKSTDTLSPNSVGPTPSTQTPWTMATMANRQGKMPAPRSNAITNAVIHYLVQDLRPFSTIESKPFRNMLSSLDPRYQPPSRHTVSEKIIPALVVHEKALLQKDLDQAIAVALTSDGWTSRSADSYLTITCHYLKDWTLLSKVLQTEQFYGSHTGEHVGLELNSAMVKWQIRDKVKVITVDNASNMTAAIRVSGVDLKLGCFAHTLNLASNKALNIQSLSKVLGKVRSIVTFFHKSCIGTEYLKQKQLALGLPNHKLVIDCKTRWNSTYNMLQRFLEQRPAILATLLDDRVKNVSAKAKLTGLSDIDINACEVFVKIMEVMVTATLVMSEAKSPSVGLVLPLLNRLQLHFTAKPSDDEFEQSLKQAVGADLAGRYSDPDLIIFLQEASAIDPRTKNKPCVSNCTWERLCQKAVNAPVMVTVKQEPNIPEIAAATPELPQLPDIQSEDEVRNISKPSEGHIVPKVEPSQTKTALETLFDDDSVTILREEPPLPIQHIIEKEIESYKALNPLPISSNPLEFWKEHTELVHLSRLAQHYFCVQATSVASERVFSTAGDIVSATRSCLKSEAVDSLIFLKKNMQMP